MSVFKMVWYCRWCKNVYEPVKQTVNDGFCCDAHKQALHRARKAYVTSKKQYSRSTAKIKKKRNASDGKKKKNN